MLKFKDYPIMISYVRKNNNELSGVMVCIKEQDSLRFGWAKYNKKAEEVSKVPFIKVFGRDLAIARAQGGRTYELSNPTSCMKGDVPSIIKEKAPKFLDRCRRYFKIGTVLNIN